MGMEAVVEAITRDTANEGGDLMLFWVFQQLAEVDSFFNVFGYITLRTILAALTALLLSLLLGPWFIRRLVRQQMGQPIRKLGPESHFVKAGTPTMGGALILFAIVLSTLLWADLGNRYVWVVILVTLAFGLIGWIDDYRKLVLQDSAGLPARWKYLGQSVVGLVVAGFLYMTADVPAATELIVPFFKGVAIPLGVFYIVTTYFMVVGFSNAVNLTDGLDGLAIMPSVFVAAALGIFAYVAGHSVFSAYLGLPFLPGAGELAIFLRRPGRRRPGLPLVQHLPGADLHGRHRSAGGRRGARPDRRHRAAGTGVHRDGRRVRDGNGVGDPAGGVVQADRQADFPHGADPPSLRTQGLAGAAGHCAVLDHLGHSRAGRAGDAENQVSLSMRKMIATSRRASGKTQAFQAGLSPIPVRPGQLGADSGLLLLSIGIVMVGSASIAIAEGQGVNSYHYLLRHLVFIAIGVGLALTLRVIPIAFLERISRPMMALSVLLAAGRVRSRPGHDGERQHALDPAGHPQFPGGRSGQADGHHLPRRLPGAQGTAGPVAVFRHASSH